MPGTFASPFASSSLWNTPIDQLDPIYSDPGSIEDVQFRDTSLANTWASFQNFVYDTPANAPLVTWTYNVLNQTPGGGTFTTNGTIQLPTPTNLSFGNGSDGWAIFSDPDGVHYWEVWEGSYNSVTMTYQAASMVEGNYVSGTGWGQNGVGAGIRASGASLLGGIVTQDELNNLSIDHALSIELSPQQLEAGVNQSDQFVFPAVSADTGSVGTYTGTIPMGAHFALPPSLDLADAGLTPEGLALAEAYQTYGGYVVDSAGQTTSLAQIEGGTTQQYNDIFANLTWIRDHLVMTSTPVSSVIESFGSTSLVQVGSHYYFNGISTGTGPELKYSGAVVVAGTLGGWTPIGVEQTANGYEVAWKMTGADQYTVWNTDSNGNYVSQAIGAVSGTDLGLESLENSFHQDLNGDGVIGPPTIVIESFGSTSLGQVGNNYYLDSISTGTGPELKLYGAAVVAGQFGTIALIGAEQTSSGYDVAWKVPGADQYIVWSTDSSGSYRSAITGPSAVSGSSTTLESLEMVFHQDLNGDGVIGPTTVIESLGSTSLVQVGSNFYFDSISTGTGPELKYSGAVVVAGTLGGWTPIGVEQTANGYEVAWKMTGADQYTVWNTDSNGSYVSQAIGAVSGTDLGLESLENSFHQDLNGDGVIGPPAKVIESFGSTSLVQVGNNYYFDSISTGTGPELKLYGAAVVAGEFGTLAPIGAEQTSSGYDVAWKVPGADQYIVWSTDSSGSYLSAITGPSAVSGSSTTLESLETLFHQDLNGDGLIGNPIVTIESFGSTSLVKVGNNYYFDSISTGTGPELKLYGAAVVAGQFGTIAPIGAEQTSSGYDVAWKVPGADQYIVWSTDSGGNYLSPITGPSPVSGTSTMLESLETVFHQDLNGDGVIGIVTAIAAGAMVELAGASNAAVKFVGATGTLILDQSAAFSGQINNLTGNGNLNGSDQLDLKDIVFAAGVTDSYTGNSSGGVLTVSDAQNHVAHIALTGNYIGSTFSLSSDGHGGTVVVDPVVPDSATGKLSLGEAQSPDTYSVGVSPENEMSAYIGNFTVDAPNASNGQVSTGWHFNFGETNANQEVTQSYNVSLVDTKPSGISQTTSQTVSVSIGGPGQDSFIFHPGVGPDIVANAKSTDTVELHGFSAVTNNHQLATLLQEAQAGISQSVFSSANDGHDTTINLGNHDSITLAHIQLANLHANNFIIN
jgi:hypothetical protein